MQKLATMTTFEKKPSEGVDLGTSLLCVRCLSQLDQLSSVGDAVLARGRHASRLHCEGWSVDYTPCIYAPHWFDLWVILLLEYVFTGCIHACVCQGITSYWTRDSPASSLPSPTRGSDCRCARCWLQGGKCKWRETSS